MEDGIHPRGEQGGRLYLLPGDGPGRGSGATDSPCGPRTLVVMNRFPYNNGHLLVAPVRHVSQPRTLNQDETLGLLLMVRKSIEILKQIMKPDVQCGLNLGHVAAQAWKTTCISTSSPAGKGHEFHDGDRRRARNSGTHQSNLCEANPVIPEV